MFLIVLLGCKMIKEGQVYQLRENENNRLAIKAKQHLGFFEVQTKSGVLYSISEYAISKNYNLAAEYKTFEDAIASSEFKGGEA